METDQQKPIDKMKRQINYNAKYRSKKRDEMIIYKAMIDKFGIDGIKTLLGKDFPHK